MPYEIKFVSVLAFQSSFYAVVAVSIFAGYVRAAPVINQNLTISEYCDDAKLPAAIGLNMVAKGLFVLSVGQLLGKNLYLLSFSLYLNLFLTKKEKKNKWRGEKDKETSLFLFRGVVTRKYRIVFSIVFFCLSYVRYFNVL